MQLFTSIFRPEILRSLFSVLRHCLCHCLKGIQRNLVKSRWSLSLIKSNELKVKHVYRKIPDTLIFPLRGREIKRSFELDLQVNLLASTVISQLPAKWQEVEIDVRNAVSKSRITISFLGFEDSPMYMGDEGFLFGAIFFVLAFRQRDRRNL